jgi:hypothetical protein
MENTSSSYTNHRLPGQRLSIRVPNGGEYTYPSRTLNHRPSSASVIEVPVKLDSTWLPSPMTPPAALRVMSDPGFLEQGQVDTHQQFTDPHPGRKVQSVYIPPDEGRRI